MASLNIKVEALAAVLQKTLTPYDKVLTGYSSYREEAKSTLAFGSERSCIIFVAYDSGGIVQDIWLDLRIASPTDKQVTLRALQNFTELGDLLLVDWSLGALVKLSDEQQLLSYFDALEESRPHAFRALRQYFDDQDKN